MKLVLGWLRAHTLSDAEMADALGLPTTNYSRRKDADDFPSFEELGQLAKHFKLSPLALQVAFGYLDPAVVLLDDDGLRQYIEQGGGARPSYRQYDGELVGPTPRRHRRKDAPPGP